VQQELPHGIECERPIETSPSKNGVSKIRTSYDEQGRSYVEVDDEAWKHATVQDWIGGIPDTWKRR
jgi:hypothetical protein